MNWMPTRVVPSSPASTSTIDVAVERHVHPLQHQHRHQRRRTLSLSSTCRGRRRSRRRASALNGGNFHFAASTLTVSVWPMMSSGRFRPLPFSRATTFGRFGLERKICAGMPLSSSTCFRYSAAGSLRLGRVEADQRLVVAQRLLFDLRPVRGRRGLDDHKARNNNKEDPAHHAYLAPASAVTTSQLKRTKRYSSLSSRRS